MLTWILILVGGIVAIPVLAAIIGFLLPAEFAGGAELVIAAPPDTVWTALTDVEKHPFAGAQARRVNRMPDEGGLPVWQEDLGQTVITARVVELEPNRRRVVEASDSVVPISIRSVCELTAVPEGTRLRIENRGRIERGTWHVPFFRFMMHVLNGKNAAPTDYIRRIKLAAEGQAATR